MKITVNKSVPLDNNCELTLSTVLAFQLLPILNFHCPLELKEGSIKQEGDLVKIKIVLPEKIVKVLIKAVNKGMFPNCQHDN